MSLIKKDYDFETFISLLTQERAPELIEVLIELYDEAGSEIRLKDDRRGVYILGLGYNDEQLTLTIERIKHKLATLQSNHKAYGVDEELHKALKAVQLLLHREIDVAEASDPEQFG
jgi:hypothetical protein